MWSVKPKIIVLFLLFRGIEKVEKGEGRRRERILSRLHTQSRAWCGAWSHDPEIMIWTKIQSWMLNQLSHPGPPVLVFLIWPFTKKKKKVYQARTLSQRNWGMRCLVSLLCHAQSPNSPGYPLSLMAELFSLNFHFICRYMSDLKLQIKTERKQCQLRAGQGCQFLHPLHHPLVLLHLPLLIR